MKQLFVALCCLFAAFLPATAVAQGQLIGTYSVSYLYNASGCGPGAPNPFDCSYLSGPILVDPTTTPPGDYRVDIVAPLDPSIIVGGFRVWDGDANGGTPYTAGDTIHHSSGNIWLYAHDWYPWDNPPSSGWTVAVYALSSCPVQSLAPVIDVLSQQFEASANPNTCQGLVDKTHLTPTMQAALTCMENVTAMGSSLPVTSAYRPPAYQAHLLEVWTKWRQLRNDNTPQCNSLKSKVQTEATNHCLLGLATAPAGPTGSHAQGKAFDLGFPFPIEAEALLDSYAATCGLGHPMPFSDKVHFQQLH
jgi:hypothetical protein